MALSLPTEERAALAEEILGSLDEAERANIHRRQLTGLREAVAEQIERGHKSDPGRVWGEAEWQALQRGERRHPPEEDSWALPPGTGTPGPKLEA